MKKIVIICLLLMFWALEFGVGCAPSVKTEKEAPKVESQAELVNEEEKKVVAEQGAEVVEGDVVKDVEVEPIKEVEEEEVVDVSAVANDPAQRLPESVETAFLGIRNDKDPDSLVRNSHYWISNENSHYVWYPHIKDKGDVFCGVGTDQVYLLAGWARSSIIVPLDFDKAIRNLHYVYGALFLKAETPEEFLSYWGKNKEREVEAALEEYFPQRKKEAFTSYKQGRSNVNGRLRGLVKKYKGLNIPTFVSDQAEYDFIRMLWRNHRVFPVCGDLTEDLAMMDMAKVLNEQGLKLGLYYPSNAEHYFEFTPKYRRNIIAQPFSDDSLVIRTRQMSFLGLAEEKDYHYNMQSGENFKIWLSTTRIPDQYKMLRQRTKTDNPGLSIMDKVPEPSAKAPEIAE